MAESVAGRLLTEAHRRSQLQLRASTIREFLLIWPAFSIEDIDGSWPAVEAALLGLIAARRRQSSEVAADYYRLLRRAEGAPGTAAPVLAEAPNPILTLATLRLLGPIQAKKNIAARVTNPAERTLTRLSGSVTRQVLDGGRETLVETIRADGEAAGWQRVTSGRPCSFCAQLASEGITGPSAGFQAHDHCGCSQEPVWKRLDPVAPDAFQNFLGRFEAQVQETTASGNARTFDTSGGFAVIDV